MSGLLSAPWWLIVPVLALTLFVVRKASALPGSWSSAIDSELSDFATRWVRGSAERSARWLRWLLCLLICLGLAGPEFGVTDVPPLRSLHGRYLVIDMGPGASPDAQIFMARQLAKKAPAIPTGVIASSGESFNIVPLTDDTRQLDRYLNVLKADLMPNPGRNLETGIRRAGAALQRAGILAGQIVVLSGGEAPELTDESTGERKFPVYLFAVDGKQAQWQNTANQLNAGLMLADSDTKALDLSLNRSRSRKEKDARPVSERQLGAPWIALLCLPLWLWLFMRRSGQ